MGCCNEPATALALATPDASQHVHYAKGMVLGVDDFMQEFAYHAGRGQWLARDSIGYGTLSGLRVFTEFGGDGPRLHVGAGTALTPGGRLVCVPADQCALFNLWLARPDNAAVVNRLLNPASPPPPPASPPLSPPSVTAGTVPLYLTLCYADCQTRPVPIPGEPCRSEDELMAPSRVADDFRLELRGTAPVQAEEDALRDFVRWLRDNVRIVTTGGTAAASWLDTLRTAAGPWLEQTSPPATFETLSDYLFDLSPAVDVDADDLCDFLRVAFRFWVTELRPLWQAARCRQPPSAEHDCVLLARVDVDIEWIGGSPTGAWQVVTGSDTVRVDESGRPFIAHLRMLQEWLLCGRAGEFLAGGGAPGLSPPATLPPAAPDDAGYVVAAADGALTNAQSLGALPTGLLLNTVAAGTGTLSAATPGVDYYAPGAATIAVAEGGTGTATPPTDGQLLIGSGGAYVPATVTGTPDQVVVTTGAGTLAIAAPQDLATTSSPQFRGLSTTGARVVALVNSAAANLALNVNHHVVVSTGIGPSTIRLPQSNPNRGRVYVIKNRKTAAGVVTVTAAAGDNVDSAGSVTLNVNNAVTVIAGGGNTWHVIGRV
jgi:hypothetical protein